MASRLDDAVRIQPATRAEWREWLASNHAASPGVWLVTFKRSSGRPRLEYVDVIAEALCFGWIDGVLRRLDDERTMLYVAPRRRGGTWARSNKARVERLIAEGLMSPAGLAVVEAARADGSWTSLDAVEALEVPQDLAAALDAEPAARAGYEAMSASAKKMLLGRVSKREAPRDARATGCPRGRARA